MKRVRVEGAQAWIVIALCVLAFALAEAVDDGASKIVRACGAPEAPAQLGDGPRWAVAR